MGLFWLESFIEDAENQPPGRQLLSNVQLGGVTGFYMQNESKITHFCRYVISTLQPVLHYSDHINTRRLTAEHTFCRSLRYMISCLGNCLNLVSLATGSKGVTVCLQPNGSVTTGSAQWKMRDDRTHFYTIILPKKRQWLFFQCEKKKTFSLSSIVILLLHTENAKCVFIKQPVTGTMGLPYSRDQASFTALLLHPSLPPASPLCTLLHLSPLPPFHFLSSHTAPFSSHSIFAILSSSFTVPVVCWDDSSVFVGEVSVCSGCSA